jgi:hypothetical protein
MPQIAIIIVKNGLLRGAALKPLKNGPLRSGIDDLNFLAKRRGPERRQSWPPANRGSHMASIPPFIRNRYEATRIMGEAFEAACKDLHDTGQPS